MISINGCSMTAGRDTAWSPVESVDVIKSPADNRDYRHITLDNGLSVLLISDPETDKAAAAVDVNTGSYMDPGHRLGLSHFLEHMLFMGTEKYPDVESYSEFIRANGGSSNAYTADIRTNYYFDINSTQLQPALDRLAQFFISPKLDPDYVERERNAVDSEYRLHAREDSWRLFMALNATANPDHPKSRFTIGSLDTLNNDDGKLWKDLRQFYDHFYVASNMSVVVYGREPLDTLAQWVGESFSEVPAGDKPELSIGKPPYTSEGLGVRVNVVPLKETRVLSLNFPLESVQAYYRKKPLGYLSRILGYEGSGSLHSLLKEQGLIDSLTTYNSELPHEYSEFVIRMELTPKGLEQVDEITALVFDQLALIRREGIRQRLFDETRQIAELEFRYQQDRNPQQTASGLAARMHYLPPEHLLNANYLYEAFDPELIARFLDEMTPQNLRQVVIAQDLETDRVEPYFDTHYRTRPLSPQLISRLESPQTHDKLFVPEPNEFIATDLELRDSDDKLEPEIIIDEKGLRLWHQTDTSFAMPRGSVRVMVSTDKAARTPADYAAAQVYRALLARSLNEYGYPAREAGLNYGLSSSRRGLMISLSGYQDKQPELLEDILLAMDNFKPGESAFDQEKASLIRRLNNKSFQAPYRLAMDALGQVTYPLYPADDVLLKAVEKMTFADLKAFSKDFYRSINVEMLVYGNFSQKEAISLAHLVEKHLLTADNRAGRFDEPFHLLADTDHVLTMDIKHDDSVFIRYYQRPETSNIERARYALLGRLLANPFYNDLRTEQQLGYIVMASGRPVEKHPGVIFIVQSPRLDPRGIEERVNEFLARQVERFKTLSDKELEQYRQGLINDLLKRDDNLDDRNARFWQGIVSNETDFENRRAIAKDVASMTPEDMRVALDTLLQDQGRLVVRSFGVPHQSAYKKDAGRRECDHISCFDGLPLSR